MNETKCEYDDLQKQLSEILLKHLKKIYCADKPPKIPDDAARTELNRHEYEYIVKLSKLLDSINSFYEKMDLIDELIESEKLEQLQEILLEISNNSLIEIGRYYNDCITHD